MWTKRKSEEQGEMFKKSIIRHNTLPPFLKASGLEYILFIDAPTSRQNTVNYHEKLDKKTRSLYIKYVI